MRGGGSLSLQEKFLIEGLVFVAPFVSVAPAGMASISTVPSSGFKGEVQQVIQADFFGSSKLSRAKLGPACLCYLQKTERTFLLFTLQNGRRTWEPLKPPPPTLPPHVVLHLQLHTAAHLSEGVSCQNSCLSVNWCGEGQEKCHFWERRAHACGCSAWSFHYFCFLKHKAKTVQTLRSKVICDQYTSLFLEIALVMINTVTSFNVTRGCAARQQNPRA